MLSKQQSTKPTRRSVSSESFHRRLCCLATGQSCWSLAKLSPGISLLNWNVIAVANFIGGSRISATHALSLVSCVMLTSWTKPCMSADEQYAILSALFTLILRFWALFVYAFRGFTRRPRRGVPCQAVPQSMARLWMYCSTQMVTARTDFSPWTKNEI